VQAEKMLGVTANELNNMRAEDPQAYEKVFADAMFKPLIMKVRDLLFLLFIVCKSCVYVAFCVLSLSFWTGTLAGLTFSSVFSICVNHIL
jgi:hypothetical protein